MPKKPTTDEETLMCGECGAVDEYPDGFDCVLACPGNVFCLDCGAEIDATTGKKGKLCGQCSGCKELEQMAREQPSLF